VKTDLRYWPCWRLALDPATAEWQRELLSPPLDVDTVADGDAEAAPAAQGRTLPAAGGDGGAGAGAGAAAAAASGDA